MVKKNKIVSLCFQEVTSPGCVIGGRTDAPRKTRGEASTGGEGELALRLADTLNLLARLRYMKSATPYILY